ncbi:hypothetical protein BaRGS_00035879 [Batillaria attramentaria]|uniref:Uncharacterized protein n=1 Tax=Batillaria attramentaria TaxID=370345 RepID=A0ABD0JCX3_9CAEN
MYKLELHDATIPPHTRSRHDAIRLFQSPPSGKQSHSPISLRVGSQQHINIQNTRSRVRSLYQCSNQGSEGPSMKALCSRLVADRSRGGLVQAGGLFVLKIGPEIEVQSVRILAGQQAMHDG